MDKTTQAKMKKQTKPDGFDSYEELYMSWYLKELIEKNYVLEYRYQPYTITLSEAKKHKELKPLKTKFREDEHTFLQPHSYTPDFEILWSHKAIGVFCKLLSKEAVYSHRKSFFWAQNRLSTPVSVIDVKPIFDMQNMTRQFIINQKWLYDKKELYCQKVIPEHLFKKTFTPKRYMITDKSGKARTIKYAPVISLQEFFIKNSTLEDLKL